MDHHVGSANAQLPMDGWVWRAFRSECRAGAYWEDAVSLPPLPDRNETVHQKAKEMAPVGGDRESQNYSSSAICSSG